MPVIAILGAVFIVAFEELVEWKYGPTGVIGLLLFAIGVKARNPTCSSIGAVVLMLTVTSPAA
ncbi:hypothetical protein U9R90_29840 [Streptomyces sp. E11-3]|uniref:hypothetical protein n=1 Tax=Streptomyces sp. E11-3 TaxID=3110112 RepID=UPI0039816B28